MTLHLSFTDDNWHRIEQDWNAWWAGELNRPMIFLTTQDQGVAGDPSQLTKFGLDTPLDDILDNWECNFNTTRWHGDAFPKWWPNYGPGALAAFLGSEISWTPDTTWFWPLSGVGHLSELRIVADPRNPWRQRVLTLSHRAVERWKDQVIVGMTDLGGNLDILASLRGAEKLLVDLIEVPKEVDRLTAEVTAVWQHCYDELYAIGVAAGRGSACWGPIWLPGKGHMLQSDLSYMISPRMFQRFVLPDLESCCEHLDYAFYHMDGKGEIPHLDYLLSIERLRGIQWQPGDGQPRADHWLPLLQRIRQAGKLCYVDVTCEGALTIQRELGGKGFVLNIIDQNLTAQQAEAFIREFYTRK